MKKSFLISILLLWCVISQAQEWQTSYDSLSTYLLRGDFSNAYQVETALIAKAKNQYAQDNVAYADVAFSLGKIFHRATDYQKAKKHYWEALMIRRKELGDKHPKYEESIQQLGVFFEELGNYQIAERIYMADLSLNKTIFGRKSGEYASSLNELGNVYTNKSDFPTADLFYQNADSTYKQSTGDRTIDYAETLTDRGYWFYQMGEYTVAENNYRKAIQIFKDNKLDESPNYARTLNNLALLNLELNNHSQAYQRLDDAKKIYAKHYGKDHPTYAQSLFREAQIHLLIDELEQAEKKLLQAQTIYKGHLSSTHPDFLLISGELANLYRRKKDFPKSEELYLAVMDTFRLTLGENHIQYAMLEADLAQLYYDMGSYEDAIAYHQRSIDLRKLILHASHPHYFESISDLSQLYWASKRRGKAERFLKKTAKNYEQQTKTYFTFLNEKEKGFYFKNIRTFYEKFNAFAIKRHTKKPRLLGNMYDYALTNKALLFSSNQEIKEHIFETDVDGKPDSLLIKKYQNWILLKEQLAKAYKFDKKAFEAEGFSLASLEDAAGASEKELSLRVKLKTKKAKKSKPLSWKDIQNQLTSDEAAIEIIRFQDFLPDSGGYFVDKVFYAALIVTQNTKKNPALVLLENGQELEGKYLYYYRKAIQFEIEDEVSYKQFWEPIANAEALKGIKKLYLSPDGVYNQISLNTLYDTKNEEFVVDKVNIHNLSNTKDLIKLRNSYRTKHKTNPSVFVGFPSYDLQIGKDENSSTQIDKTAIGDERGSMAIFLSNAKDLPSTKTEVEKASNLLRSAGELTEVYVGKKASETMIKQIHSPKILHMATHGFFKQNQENAIKSNGGRGLEQVASNPSQEQKNQNQAESQQSPIAQNQVEAQESQVAVSQVFVSQEIKEIEKIDKLKTSLKDAKTGGENPLFRSGLLFTGSNYAYHASTQKRELQAFRNKEQFDDGILTAYEAMNLDLQGTELVVISACETGLGVVSNGEGVYGLQRALQTAGAKSIIMSLWKVDDLATSKLMIAFYTEWLISKDKREAFQLAQKELRADPRFESPYFWGAFVMIGE
jgi:CHAT domain-containing protein